MTDDLARLLDELEAAHGKATPGEWYAQPHYTIEEGCRCLSCWEPIKGSWDVNPVDGPDCADHDNCFHNIRVGEADARFIAAAHNAVPRLIAELRRRDEALAAVRELAEEWRRPTDWSSHYRDGLRDASTRLRAVLAAHEQAEQAEEAGA